VKDPTLPDINLASGNERWTRGVFVSNSFAFGGSNTAVAIGRA
jgi:3-oxoacyl-(acyl-carrier-protein) synthase